MIVVKLPRQIAQEARGRWGSTSSKSAPDPAAWGRSKGQDWQMDTGLEVPGPGDQGVFDEAGPCHIACDMPECQLSHSIILFTQCSGAACPGGCRYEALPQSWIFDNPFLMGDGARKNMKLPAEFCRTQCQQIL